MKSIEDMLIDTEVDDRAGRNERDSMSQPPLLNAAASVHDTLQPAAFAGAYAPPPQPAAGAAACPYGDCPGRGHVS